MGESDSDTGAVKEIWDRQVGQFWQILWVVSDSPDSKALHQRKAWRIPYSEPEGGDPCSVMGEYQEISNCGRGLGGRDIDGRKYYNREQQKEFWKTLQKNGGQKEGTAGISPFDMPEFDRMCSIAIVKRLFPLLAIEDKTLLGYKLTGVKSWPSTAHMAAIPFKTAVKKSDAATTKQANDYAGFITDETNSMWGKLIRSSFLGAMEHKLGEGFADLGGSFLYESSLESAWTRNVLSEENSQEMGKEIATEAIQKLRVLTKAVGGRPSPFYALLAMDGDLMGTLFRDAGKKAKVLSKCLAGFSGGVDKIITSLDGQTIYAGGDDVFAIIPVPQVLRAAEQLKDAYLEHMKNAPFPDKTKATISAGIVFARFNVPLMDVVAVAHHTLEDIAKAKAGRNACAVTVLKGGSENITWAGQWEQVENIHNARHKLESKTLSRSFVHKVIGLLQRLTHDPKNRGGYFRIPKNIGMDKLIISELQRSADRQGKDQDPKETQDLADIFCKASKPPNGYAPSPPLQEDESLYQPSGLLLARFLQQHGGLLND